jgi:hypothetical protein
MLLYVTQRSIANTVEQASSLKKSKLQKGKKSNTQDQQSRFADNHRIVIFRISLLLANFKEQQKLSSLESFSVSPGFTSPISYQIDKT